MKIVELIDFLKNHSTEKEFKVLFNDGRVEKKRLFYSDKLYTPYEYLKGKKSYGSPLYDSSIESWVEINSITKIDKYKKVRNFLSNSVKYLSVSGLWSNMKNDFEKLLSLSENEFKYYIDCDYNERFKLDKEYNISQWVDDLVYSAYKGIKTINYYKYERDEIREIVKNKITNNGDYRYKWRNVYDNCVETTTINGIYCGWYSEEYKDCGNGYYYLMLDEKRAIFIEKD